MTRSAHFMPVRNNFLAEDYAKLYLVEIMKLDGALVSIILDCGP